VVTNSVESRPLTVGLQVFASTDQGIDWSIITAATLMTSAPLLVGFLLFQRQFVQSFMRAGIKSTTCPGRRWSGCPIRRPRCRRAAIASTCPFCTWPPRVMPTRW
jgi:hypothetical protein